MVTEKVERLLLIFSYILLVGTICCIVALAIQMTSYRRKLGLTNK